MASNANDEVSRPILFTTETRYPLPSQKFMIPSSWKRYQLSQLINKALSLPKPVPFDFLVRGEILRTSLGEWCTEKGIGDVRVYDVWLYSNRLTAYVRRKIPWKLNTSSRLCLQSGWLTSLTRIGFHQYPVKSTGKYRSLFFTYFG